MASMFGVEEVSAVVSRAARKLGYGHLKEKHYQAVSEFVSGKDVFVSLPTGGGKSLCYAVLPSVFDTLRNRTIPTSLVIVEPIDSLHEG